MGLQHVPEVKKLLNSVITEPVGKVVVNGLASLKHKAESIGVHNASDVDRLITAVENPSAKDLQEQAVAKGLGPDPDVGGFMYIFGCIFSHLAVLRSSGCSQSSWYMSLENYPATVAVAG